MLLCIPPNNQDTRDETEFVWWSSKSKSREKKFFIDFFLRFFFCLLYSSFNFILCISFHLTVLPFAHAKKNSRRTNHE